MSLTCGDCLKNVWECKCNVSRGWYEPKCTRCLAYPCRCQLTIDAKKFLDSLETPKATNVAIKHDTNKNRIDLIPPELIFALGDILTDGAAKYTRPIDNNTSYVLQYAGKELVKCLNAKNVTLKTLLVNGVDFVGTATNESLEQEILSMQNVNAQTRENGVVKIESVFESTIQDEKKTLHSESEMLTPRSEMPSKKSVLQKKPVNYYCNDKRVDAEFVRDFLSLALRHTWIIVTQTATHEDIFVVDATTDLECWETLLALSKKHYNISETPLPKVWSKDGETLSSSITGEHNWAKGMKYSRVFGACMRHLWQWWWTGEPDKESGKSHLWHAAACIAFLIAYEVRKVGEDDRQIQKPTEKPFRT